VNLLLKQFLETQLDVLTATTAGLTIAFDVQFGFDASTGIVGPDVKILSSTGTVVLLSTSAGAPAVIQGATNAILLAVQADLQTFWMAALTTALKLLLTDWLRNLGLECPLGATPLGLTAASGSAESFANSRLTLFAEMVHDPATPSHPFAVQVPTGETLARQLELCHGAMRSDLLAPVPPSPGKPPSPPPIGVYGGIALSQNAINQYADVQWRSGAFQWDTADGTDIAKLLALSPKVATLFPRSVHRIHAWLSASPRIELAEGGFANLDLPLVAYLDDLRICFQAIGPSDHDVPGNTPMLELSANASASAAVVLDGLTPRILFDRTTVAIDDERVWAIADPNLPMLQVVPSDWRALVLYVATSLLIGWDATNRPVVPAAPPPWHRPLPATAQQQLFAIGGKGGLAPQDGYFEQLASRRALYLLPAIRSQLLELVDGSGAPTLTSSVRPAMAGAPPPVPVTITNLTCAEGASLRIVFDSDAVIPP
jgi:hypothetical protein